MAGITIIYNVTGSTGTAVTTIEVIQNGAAFATPVTLTLDNATANSKIAKVAIARGTSTFAADDILSVRLKCVLTGASTWGHGNISCNIEYYLD